MRRFVEEVKLTPLDLGVVMLLRSSPPSIGSLTPPEKGLA